MVVGFLLTLMNDVRMVVCLWYKCAETSQRMVMVRTAPLCRTEYKKGPGIHMEIDCTHVIVLHDERLDNPAKYYNQFIAEAGWIGGTMVNKDPPKNKSKQKNVTSKDWVYKAAKKTGVVTYRHALTEELAITTPSEDALNTSMSQISSGSKKTPKFGTPNTPKTPASTSTEGTEKCTSVKDRKKEEKRQKEEAKQLARERKEEEEARQEEKDRKKQEEKDKVQQERDRKEQQHQRERHQREAREGDRNEKKEADQRKNGLTKDQQKDVEDKITADVKKQVAEVLKTLDNKKAQKFERVDMNNKRERSGGKKVRATCNKRKRKEDKRHAKTGGKSQSDDDDDDDDNDDDDESESESDGSDSGDGSDSDDDRPYNCSAASRARGTLRQQQQVSTLETELQIQKQSFQNLNQDNERREFLRRKNSEDARQLEDALEREGLANTLKKERKKNKKLKKKLKKQFRKRID